MAPAMAAAQGGALDPGRSGDEIVVLGSLPDGRAAPWLEAVVRQLAPLGASPENAVGRFEQRHSSAPAEVSNDDVDRWIEQSRAAVRHLAQTDYARARDALLEAQALSERAAEALNREAELQRHVLDTCLFMVRAFLETRAIESAEAQARECRRLVPRGAISRLHTPEVRELMRRVDHQLMEEEPGFLRVDADRAGCVVRLNGIDFGRTPFEMHDLARGEYRVQVECDEHVRGRVHRVQLEANGTRIAVDTRFDAAIRTEPVLHLRYADAASEATARAADAVSVARAAGAREAWVVTPIYDDLEAPAPAYLRVDRFRVGRVVELGATALLPAPAEGERPFHEPVAHAAREALASGRSVDLRSGTALVLDEAPAYPTGIGGDDAAPASRGRRAVRGLGIGLVSAGVGLFGASAGLYFRRAELGDAFEREDPWAFQLGVQEAWLDARVPLLGTGAGASASLGAGVALLLASVPRERAVPGWAWGAGAVGVGGVAAGLVDFLRADICPRDTVATPVCVPGSEQRDRALLAMLGGLSLATVPLTAWLGDRIGGATVEVRAGAGGVTARAGGTF